LSERLRELDELGEHSLHDTDEDDDSDGEDLLGEDTPGEETDEQGDTPAATDFAPSPAVEDFPEPYMEKREVVRERETQQEVDVTASGLRNRNMKDMRAELFAPTASTTGLSTATHETLMSHNRTEQDAITNNLLSTAAQLKANSIAFNASLDSEKTILNRAVEGLDKNQLGMDAAQTRMGFLRGYTEGKGWWGRMIMYAWIAGLWVLALMIVFVFPKLRFSPKL
jgi:hypothetical protein